MIFRQSANQTMLRKFNDEFKKTEDGTRRNWREIPEEQIKDIFETCKAKQMALIDEFKCIVFPQNITKVIESSTPGGDPDDTFDNVLRESASGLKRTGSTLSALKIIPEQDITRVRNKFLEDIEFVYEEAIARHRNIQTTKIPILMWIALVWFASDNIFGYLQSPILFYPIILLSGIAVILF